MSGTPAGPAGRPTGPAAKPAGPASVLTDVLADLAQRALELDPASASRLAALEGQAVQIDVALPAPLPERSLGLRVAAGRLRMVPHELEAPHALVKGSAPELLRWLAGSPGASLEIEGDTDLLQRFREVLAACQPDLGQPLERLLGRELSERALGTLEVAAAGVRSLLEGAGESLRQRAGTHFVDRGTWEDLLSHSEDLRLRVDRVAARVTALEQNRAPP